jgi:predicted RNA-binding Zn ribbon-like protein
MTHLHLPALRVVPHRFRHQDLCAGHVALDFVNTAAGLNRDPRDWIENFPGLIDWAHMAGILDRELLDGLAARGRIDPAAGAAALQRARALRSALYTLVHHRRAALAPHVDAVATLQQWCRRAGAALTLVPQESGILRKSLFACGLDAVAAAVAIEAADLLSRPLDGSLGICGGHNCGWVFLDTSATRRRRWCDMKTCGNAAKASRHYARRDGRVF